MSVSLNFEAQFMFYILNFGQWFLYIRICYAFLVF